MLNVPSAWTSQPAKAYWSRAKACHFIGDLTLSLRVTANSALPGSFLFIYFLLPRLNRPKIRFGASSLFLEFFMRNVCEFVEDRSSKGVHVQAREGSRPSICFRQKREVISVHVLSTPPRLRRMHSAVCEQNDAD